MSCEVALKMGGRLLGAMFDGPISNVEMVSVEGDPILSVS